MHEHWGIWTSSAFLFLGAILLLKSMPASRDFRKIAGGLGLLALAVTAARPNLQLHLIWFTPLALLAAYVYALRHLIGLMRRINRLDGTGISDPEQIRRTIQAEVDEYNRKAPDDAKMR